MIREIGGPPECLGTISNLAAIERRVESDPRRAIDSAAAGWHWPGTSLELPRLLDRNSGAHSRSMAAGADPPNPFAAIRHPPPLTDLALRPRPANPFRGIAIDPFLETALANSRGRR